MDNSKMVARRNELFALHRCRPWPTMLIPPLTQLPVFVGSSMFLSGLARAPSSAFDSEAFLTLTSLAHPDPTAALPIALGVITLANVESVRWFVSAEVREREEAERKRVEERRAQGQLVLEPRKVMQSALRFLSVGRILIGAVVPGVRNTFFFCLVLLLLHKNMRTLIVPPFLILTFLLPFFSSAERGALLDLICDFRSLTNLDI